MVRSMEEGLHAHTVAHSVQCLNEGYYIVRTMSASYDSSTVYLHNISKRSKEQTTCGVKCR
jgi:hypothetical protein